jgi:hypothetical protein
MWCGRVERSSHGGDQTVVGADCDHARMSKERERRTVDGRTDPVI